MNNVNDTYFDGYYKDIWRNMIPEQLTVKEVEFMVEYFQLKPGSKVLDLMCGYGRHAIALAEKGISVTAVDNLVQYIDQVKNLVEGTSLPIKAIREDVLNYVPDEKFDLVLCMGNSLNFFNEADTRLLLSKVNDCLATDGYLLIHSWSILEIVVKTFNPQSSSKIGDIEMDTTTEFLFQPTRVEAETKMTMSNGDIEIKKGVDYVFCISEYEHMLLDSGLSLENFYSIPGKKVFTIGEPRIYIIAKKQS